MNLYRHLCVPLYEGRIGAFHISTQLYQAKSFEDFFPYDSQLHFGHSITHASVYAKTERKMVSCIFSVDDKVVGIIYYLFISVSRDVPHYYFVPFFYVLPLEVYILKGCPSHVR